jgi:uncharacterized protein (DUF2147 family)
MSISRAFAVTMCIASGLAFAPSAHAESPNGTWLRSNGAHISVFDCGGGVGMKVVKSPEAAKVGKTIMCGAKKSAENKWEGSLLNLDDNQRYSGYVTLSGGSLTLSGCVLGGIICNSDTWSRLK